jgi:hypothetical protein
MNLDRAVLALQAGLLLPANLPRVATEGLAAGHHGDTLYRLAALLGEPQELVLSTVARIPNVSERVINELGAPPRSQQKAVWTLARSLARATVDGELEPREGASELTSLARAADDNELIRRFTPMEGALDQWEWIPARERDAIVVGEAQRFLSD